MFETLENKLIGLGVILLWSLLVFGYGHHKGYESGVVDGDKRAAVAKSFQTAAEEQTSILVSKLNDSNAAAQHQAVEANNQKQRADEAVAKLAQEQARHALDDASWQKKFKGATSKPECSNLKELICESAMGY